MKNEKTKAQKMMQQAFMVRVSDFDRFERIKLWLRNRVKSMIRRNIVQSDHMLVDLILKAVAYTKTMD